MEKTSAKTVSAKTSSHRKSNSDTRELQERGENVIENLMKQAKDIDKTTLAKYAGLGVLAIFGLRKSPILRSIAMSIVTGMVAKYVADKIEGSPEPSPSAN